jgi:hypothetical protein
MKNESIHRHVFVFNPQDNGGESLSLITDFIDNGDGPEAGIFTNQELGLQSYCNSASLQLMGASFTPENLRKLANELESAWIQAKTKCAKK